MKLETLLEFSVFFSLLSLFSQSEGAKDWSGQDKVTAIQGEATTLVWTVNLTASDVNEAWTYVKIFHAEGSNTDELVTFKRTGEKTIENPSYSSRLSDMIFDISQSGTSVIIRFKMANLVRTTDMKKYKAQLGFKNDASTYPDLTLLIILVKPHSTELKIKPEKNTFCLGDKVNITCKADGIPPAQIYLFLNNQLVQSDNTSLTLSAESLNVKGESSLVCVPNNTAGIGQMRNITLFVKEPPKIVRCRINDEKVRNKSVIEGTKVTLSCHVMGSKPLNITWNKGNAQTSLSQSNTLTFGSINRRDTGQYRLTAYNGRECDKAVTKTLNVTVMYGEKAGKITESDDKTGTYVGIGVGIFLFLLVLVLTFVCCYKRRGKNPAPTAGESNGTPGKNPAPTAGESNGTPGRNPAPTAGESNGTPGKEMTAPFALPSASPQDDGISIIEPEIEIRPDGTKILKGKQMKIPAQMAAQILQGNFPSASLLQIGAGAHMEEVGPTELVPVEID